MAGYFIDGCHLDPDVDDKFVHSVSIDNPNIIGHIEACTQSRVLTLQVDGDERDAVLWGLATYKKAEHQPMLRRLYEIAKLYVMANRS